MLREGSVTSIRGGGVGHAKWVILRKRERKELENVRVLVLLIGGNDYADGAPGGQQRVTMGVKELGGWMDEMVRWVLAQLPAIEVRVLDLLLRLSEHGVFADGVRRWNSGVQCVQEGRHRHISIWRAFAIESRRWKNKTGKGNRGGEEAKKKKRENPLPQDCHRIELRHGLFGDDGVHLSSAGKKVLASILNWQLSPAPSDFKDIATTVWVENKRETLDLRVSFKF